MIYLGLDNAEKDARISAYVAEHHIGKVVMFSPARWRWEPSLQVEHIEWAEIIMYRHYYRLLQEIDGSTLLVINECLRTQNRYELTYNCLRNFLNQTTHQIIFQRFPLIDTVEDFMILFDLDTRSRWKRETFERAPLRESQIEATSRLPALRAVPVAVDETTQIAYAREKRRLIDNLGHRDPHTIPRNLHLMTGKAKLAHVDPFRRYVGRNKRFRLDNLDVYREATVGRAPYSVFEFPHDFIRFSDFFAETGQQDLDVLVADLPVDRWYFERYTAWTQRLSDAYSALQQ